MRVVGLQADLLDDSGAYLIADGDLGQRIVAYFGTGGASARMSAGWRAQPQALISAPTSHVVLKYAVSPYSYIR